MTLHGSTYVDHDLVGLDQRLADLIKLDHLLIELSQETLTTVRGEIAATVARTSSTRTMLLAMRNGLLTAIDTELAERARFRVGAPL